MSNDAEVRARELLATIVLADEENGHVRPLSPAKRTAFYIRDGQGTTVSAWAAIRAMLAFAAEARSHDGEWEAMREALKPFAECADWAGDGFADDDTVGAMSYCGLTIGNLRAARSALSAVPLFDDGRI